MMTLLPEPRVFMALGTVACYLGSNKYLLNLVGKRTGAKHNRCDANQNLAQSSCTMG